MARRSQLAAVIAAAWLDLCGAHALFAKNYTMYPETVIVKRAVSALVASFVADAAAMPLHWEYDTNKIAQLVGSGNPEFFSPPLNLWYTSTVGMNTPYGQQDTAYLAVGASTGGFKPTDVETAYWTLYDPKTCPGPNKGWYLDASTKEFVEAEQAGSKWPNCGGNDNQADAVAHAIFVTALYAGDTSALLKALDPVIRVTQDTDDAAAFGCAAARLFEKVLIYNMSSLEAVNETIGDLRDPARTQPYNEDADLADKLEAALESAVQKQSNMDYVLQEGQSCDYPHTLPNIAQLVASLGDSQADWVSGVRQTILAGGDSGSRGVFIGALQGAKLGDVSLLPSDWVSKTDVYSVVEPQAAALVAHRQAIHGKRHAA